MISGSTLLLLLAAAAESGRAAPSGARAELEVCAARIEDLKARGTGGTELDRLLRRVQELAAELQRPDAAEPPLTAMPSPEELRERADAARDEADRLAAEIAAIDVRLGDLRRSRVEPPGVERAAMGTAAPQPGGDRVRALLAERAALSHRRQRAEAEAVRLDAEARAAESDN
jgi:hypothetical protein